MADIICRWRNGSAKTVVELVNRLPHFSMTSSDFRLIMNKKWPEFFRTAYQLACQLGLYYESDDNHYYSRFDHDIKEPEADTYLHDWIAKYYVPNPYVAKNGFRSLSCPTYVLKSLCDYVKEHPNCNYKDAYYASFGERADNNEDIVRNYINNLSEVLFFQKKEGFLLKEKFEGRFAFMNRNNKKEFFENFNDKEKQNQSNSLQKIFFGSPGTGKSHKVKELVGNQNEFRTTIHPDYDYAQFVGSYKPVKKVFRQRLFIKRGITISINEDKRRQNKCLSNS